MARGRMMMSAEADFGAPTIEAGEVEFEPPCASCTPSDLFRNKPTVF